MIITSFPQSWDNTRDKREVREIIDTRDVLDSILDRLQQKERSPVTSVFNLAELIMALCLGLNSDSMEWEHERYRYLEIFAHSINEVVSLPGAARGQPLRTEPTRLTKKSAASTTSQIVKGKAVRRKKRQKCMGNRKPRKRKRKR